MNACTGKLCLFGALFALAAACGGQSSESPTPDVALSVTRNLGLIGIDIDLQRLMAPLDTRPSFTVTVEKPAGESSDYLKISDGLYPGLPGKYAQSVYSLKPAHTYRACAGNGVGCLAWTTPSMDQQFKNEIQAERRYFCYFRPTRTSAAVATEFDVTLTANVLPGRYPGYDGRDVNVGAIELIGPDRKVIDAFVATFPNSAEAKDGYGGLSGVSQGLKHPAGLVVDCQL